MKKTILVLLSITTIMLAQTLLRACPCMGRITKNSPAFFIDEYDQETELTENVDTDTEILPLAQHTDGESHE